MEESEENMSSEDVKKIDSPLAVKKPKKRSMVERELETNMTSRVTSPAVISEGVSTSRYGRARRLKSELELIESQKVLLASIKSPPHESTPVKVQSPVYRMHASNSPHKSETPVTHIEDQIENIYQENISLSRFSEDTSTPSPAKKFPKVYIRKDLLQNREQEEPIMLIKNLFSPNKSASKSKTSSSKTSEQSLEKYSAKQNGHVDTSSVVKTLDFDAKKKKEDKNQKPKSKNELFELEANCPYQVGDLAWARMGTFPFWPCIITREPQSEMFVKKKLFGRVEHDILHVTFFGDNGRRSWVVDNMLRRYQGLREFVATKEKFTPEDKKKDPKLYAAFFVSDKKQAFWNISVEEAETLLREPKRLRIDIFNEMLWNSRASKKNTKSGKIISRTNSEVSLSESLYDSLFSEPEDKADDNERSKNRTRNKSFDVSEVVTACLDNMAAKTGITKIQRQSHMDRWLQKAKSKTPEKTQAKTAVEQMEKKAESVKTKTSPPPIKLNRKSSTKVSKPDPSTVAKPYRFRKRTESNSKVTEMLTNVDKTKHLKQDNSTVITIVDDSSDNALAKSNPKTEDINKLCEKSTDASNSPDFKQDNSEIADANKENLDMSVDENSSCDQTNEINNETPDTKSSAIANSTEDVNSAMAVNLNNLEIKTHSDDICKDTVNSEPVIDVVSVSTAEIIPSIVDDSDLKEAEIVPNKIPIEYFAPTADIIPQDNCDTEQSVIMKDKAPKIDNCQVMDVDESTDIITAEDKTKETYLNDPVNNCVMEVDDESNVLVQANGKTTPKSETVSSKIVDDSNILLACSDTNLKDAQCVTIEVSVTEKKNDDTLNNQPLEGLQDNMINNFQDTLTKADPNTFLGESSSQNCDVADKINAILIPQKFSTPEKTDRNEEPASNSSNIPIKKLDVDIDIRNDEINSISCISNYDLNKENTFGDKKITDEDAVADKDDVLNQSGLSGSILICNDEFDKSEKDLNESFAESIKSASILDDSQGLNADNNVSKSDPADETPKSSTNILDENLAKNYKVSLRNMESPTFTQLLGGEEFSYSENEINKKSKLPECDSENKTGLIETKSDENHTGSTREYVESPTFTQSLDNEDFFRDVNEANMSTLPQNCDKIDTKPILENINETDQSSKKDKSNKNIQTYNEESEETSDEEPSPEYECLDDEITEDFRKHMKSIESNIKDKIDEDQLVKICNEIAEKAKLSPTKYTTFDEIATQNNLSKTRSKSSNITTLKSNIVHSENEGKDLIKSLNNENGAIIVSESKSPRVKLVSSKENRSDSLVVSKEVKDSFSDNSSSKKSCQVKNDETAESDKPKTIYRTRRSLTNAIKENSDTDIKIQPSKLDDYRNSIEYDPKVLLIRLERDKLDCVSKAGDGKSLDDNKFSNNCQIWSIKRESPKNKHAVNMITNKSNIDKCQNNKLRLSLRRDSPNKNQTDNKKSQIVIKIDEHTKITNETSQQKKGFDTNYKSKTIDKEKSKKEDVVVTKSHTKKVIENIPNQTKTPEAVNIVNGYHHNIDRKFTETPDSGDTEFDIDNISLNSEDSDVSLANSVDSIPKRNLRSRPERTLENALNNSGFLHYLELKQDGIMDEHPELNEEEILTYLYKTWQYEEDLRSGTKVNDDSNRLNIVKHVKSQESPSSHKKKKSQPKNKLEKDFRDKFDKSRKTIDLGSDSRNATLDSSKAEAVPVDKSPEKITHVPSEAKEIKKKLPSKPIADPNKVNTVKQISPLKLTIKLNDVKVVVEKQIPSKSPVQVDSNETLKKTDMPVKRKTRSKSHEYDDLTSESNAEVLVVKDKNLETASSFKNGENITPKRSLRTKTLTPKSLKKQLENKSEDKAKKENDIDTESVDSEDSEIPLRDLRSKVLKETSVTNIDKSSTTENNVVTQNKQPIVSSGVLEEVDETASTVSDTEPVLKQKKKLPEKNSMEDPEFLKYLEFKQDMLIDENPQLTQDEIVKYLYNSWLYEQNSKLECTKNDDLDQANLHNLVKGLNNNEVAPEKKVKRRPKVDKRNDDSEITPKEKPRRRIAQPFYNENYSDIEEEIELFEIFKTKKSAITIVTKHDSETDRLKSQTTKPEKEDLSKSISLEQEQDNKEEVQPDQIKEDSTEISYIDDTEVYFENLTKPKPNVFKGLIREKVCEICEYTGQLVKCKGCHGMFHPECVKKQTRADERESILPSRGKKKKLKKIKSKSSEDSGSDEKLDVSADVSIEDITVPDITFDAQNFESQIEIKMKEILDAVETNYDSYSSDEGIDWSDTVAGKCEIIDVKLKIRNAPIDYSDFKCHNCQKHDIPICFVCQEVVSKTGVKLRQKCHVAHCHKYYHIECLEHWPQTQFNSGEPSKTNKKINEFFEALTCPRHVCHTCVSDDPRGCKTRFSGDKLAKCVRCPATYHSFNKCLPAGSQILTASHIICPRHCDQRAGKVPCHVNTGWCFICALGGSLICCEYCPTSFHAECLNIKPPEGNYMCEDCETGRLPLYGEMVWVKLGHYRWWPGIILHPSEIPENIMAIKHAPGDFVVRFFGQYDHFWANRGRVFPYQEGDSGRISSQKSKINEDFILAMEHAQRAYTILKNAEPDEEETLEIESSLLPPQYVKLKCNKACGSLCGKKIEDPSLSLTQCECNPDEPQPCGLYSHCLNRMLLTECGPTCRAGDRCMNRAFEKRQYPKLVPYRTPHRGWGLKTLEDIKAGQFVIEYVGELIDEEEFRRRMRRKHEIRDENFYFLTLDKERMIDAGPKGNVARFMNHCCEPNCETQKWTVLGDVRVGLFAIDDIPANSEVTFNYNLECAGIEKKRCLCGAKRCSGYIGAKPKQDESQTKKSKDKPATKRTYNKKKKLEESPRTNKPKQRGRGRPPKPKPLTELEKDVLLIKNATSNSSDETSTTTSTEDKNPKTLKRKRVSNATEEVSICNGQEPSAKKLKTEDKSIEVGD